MGWGDSPESTRLTRKGPVPEDGPVLMFNGRNRFDGLATEKPVCDLRVDGEKRLVKKK
jgi:hypothetical protein